jgi:hypothetical protein
MSAKQAILELVGRLPDTLSWQEIVDAIRQQNGSAPAADQMPDYEWPLPDLTEDEWMQAVAESWADDLNDPRQDIYTLDDGEPI